jgi:hypothetical protein
MWGPRSIAKLVPITPITIVYGTQITIVNRVYKPTYNWGGPHCINGIKINGNLLDIKDLKRIFIDL